MADLRATIAANIIDLRKSRNWTQAELAQKLNYSDKAVSKWERAESLPDVATLKEIVDLFHVSMDYLLEEEHKGPAAADQTVSRQKKRNRLVVALLSVSLVFLIATIIFVSIGLYQGPTERFSWMVFVFAMPVACVVLLVFNSIWGKRILNFVIITALLWSILLTLYLSYLSYNIWLIFMIGIPGQIIILLSANFRRKHR